MKPLKNHFVPDDMWYFVLAYLNRTRYQPIFDRKLETYDEKTGFPQFKMEWLDLETFEELAKEAIPYYINKSEEITEENIDKYEY